MNIEERYNNVLKDSELDYPLNEYDALDAIELLLLLENEFKIRLDDDRVSNFKTHEDFISYIKLLRSILIVKQILRYL